MVGVGGSLARLVEGSKSGIFQLFLSNKEVCSGIPVNGEYSDSMAWLGMIAGVTKSTKEVRVQPKMVLVNQSPLWKMSVFSGFLLAPSNTFSCSSHVLSR